MNPTKIACLCMLLSACNSEAAAVPDEAEAAAATAPTPADDPASPMSRAAKALENQLSCRNLPEAAVAMRAMLKNGLIQQIDGGSDGSVLFQPTDTMKVFGFPVVSLTGWQADKNGAMKPFYRGPGTSPPNFIAVAIRASMEEAKAAVLARGFREERYVEDHTPGATAPYRQEPGVSFEEGEHYDDTPGVVTLMCSREHPW